MHISVKSLTEIDEFAQKLSAVMQPGSVLALQGELGAGKTTFTQALARALGSGDIVTSPTFTILHQYDLTNHRILNHFDLYRLETHTELESLGFLDLLTIPNTLTVIEWPEIAKDLLPDHSIWMKFEIENEHTRNISLPEHLIL